MILGGQTAANFSITFHNTQADADTNTAGITPANAVSLANASSVFARIENATSPSCFDTTEIMFFVEVSPILNPVPAQIVCDDASNDGVEIFDLSVIETAILGTQNPAGVDITFHNSQAGANTGTNPITPITAVELADQDSVFARIESTISSCFETTEIVFTVSAAPFANNVSNQVVCDDPSNDGVEAFDLTTLETDILGTQSASDFSITFHTTQVGADTNTGNITPATSAMITDNGSVFARIENSTNSSCFDTTEITFTLNESPVANPVSTQTACGDSTSGMASFDLSSFETTVLGAQTATDFTITFHNSQSDANADANAISNTTNVSLGNNDSVFVRIVNNSCLLYTSPSPRDQRGSRMPSSA